MKIFISYAKDPESHEVACALRDWLPFVIQAAKPFVADIDIGKGERWRDELARQLRDTDYGIICVTERNVNSPWLNWEAGAISKGGDRALIAPFLFRADRSKIGGPLEEFQFTNYDEAGVFELLTGLNGRLEERSRMGDEVLKITFDKWWPDLKEKLDRIESRTLTASGTDYPWLYYMDSLYRREETAECKEVWVITPHLREHALSHEASEVLRRNLGRGVSYTFLVPRTQESIEVEEEFRQYLGSCPSLPEVVQVDESEFSRQAVTTYIMLNPGSAAVEVFLELPTEERGYWIMVSNSAAWGFASRFRRLADSAREQTTARMTA